MSSDQLSVRSLIPGRSYIDIGDGIPFTVSEVKDVGCGIYLIVTEDGRNISADSWDKFEEV